MQSTLSDKEIDKLLKQAKEVCNIDYKAPVRRIKETKQELVNIIKKLEDENRGLFINLLFISESGKSHAAKYAKTVVEQIINGSKKGII